MAPSARRARRRVKVYQVDAFTGVPFGGNPAVVVPDAGGLSDSEMQLIAREMALSETAFVLPPSPAGEGRADLRVRFFTPQAEVDLCGHATIGTFWLLAELGVIGAKGWGRETPGGAADKWREIELVQETGAGNLPVRIRYGGRGKRQVKQALMAQAPPKRLGTLDEDDRRELAKIFHTNPYGTFVLHNVGDVPAEIWSTGLPDLIVPVLDLRTLRSLAPDHGRLAGFSRRFGVVSVHAYCLETESDKADAHARDFSPAVGIPEESATGTASGAMGAHMVANRLGKANSGTGPFTMLFEQGHILGRPSTIHVEVDGEPGHPAAVRVGGLAVTVLEGWLRI
jgi:trans-2,3-dihydro-3-hydroxyanthranilate isomerase